MSELNGIKNGTLLNDNNDNNNNLDIEEYKLNKEELLEIGLLPHHEIENFTMNEDMIHRTCKDSSWSNCDATTFNVRRGPNYVPGQKSPSKKALYSVFAMDAYKLPKKMNAIFEFMDIDKHVNKYKLPHKYDANKYGLPPLIILNFMIPNYQPTVVSNTYDGEGYQIIVCAHLTKEVQNELLYNKSQQRPAVKLLNDFIHSDLVNSELRNRFKVIARIMNPNYTDFGFFGNRLVRRYNSKPFLARTSSTFYHSAGRYFAADIDVHLFGYPARQGLSYVKGAVQTAIYDLGFVIEGHSDEQLPEQILACCRVSKMSVDLCEELPLKFQQIYKQRIRKRKQKQDEDEDEHDLNENENKQHKNHTKTKPTNLLNGNTTNNGTINKHRIHSIQNGNNVTLSSSNENESENHKNNNNTWGWGMFG